jgi:hypothetical protein
MSAASDERQLVSGGAGKDPYEDVREHTKRLRAGACPARRTLAFSGRRCFAGVPRRRAARLATPRAPAAAAAQHGARFAAPG